MQYFDRRFYRLFFSTRIAQPHPIGFGYANLPAGKAGAHMQILRWMYHTNNFLVLSLKFLRDETWELFSHFDRQGGMMKFFKTLANFILGGLLGFRLGAERINGANVCRLTGFKRRDFFLEDLNKRQKVKREVHPSWIIFFDIDFFKDVNEQVCYDSADYLLQLFGMTASRNFPRKDDTNNDLVRWGGDEFLIIASASREWIEERSIEFQNNFLLLLRFCEIRKKFLDIGNKGRLDKLTTGQVGPLLDQIDISFGIAEWPNRDPQTFDECRRVAEARMKQEKHRHHAQKVSRLVGA